MEKQHQEGEHFKESQQGTGSAENRGLDREAQKNQMADFGKPEESRIASEMGKGPHPLTSVRQTGGLSGREDYSGGEGDGMSEESTGEGTH